MALDLIVDSTEKLPEAVRGLYVKADDGKFRLDLSDEVIPAADVAGLKSALTSERNTVKTQKSQLTTLAPLLTIIGDKSHDDIRAALEFAADPANKNKPKTDEILRQKQTEWDKEKSGLTTKAQKAFAVARKATVDAGLTSSLAKSKVTAEGAALLPKILGERVVLEFDDEGNATQSIMQADGKTPMAGSGANLTATFDDLVKEAVKTYPSLFEGTGNGGGGTPTKQGQRGGKTLTRAEFDQLGSIERTNKIKDGFKIVD